MMALPTETLALVIASLACVAWGYALLMRG
jgi:hypothetical protein